MPNDERYGATQRGWPPTGVYNPTDLFIDPNRIGGFSDEMSGNIAQGMNQQLTSNWATSQFANLFNQAQRTGSGLSNEELQRQYDLMESSITPSFNRAGAAEVERGAGRFGGRSSITENQLRGIEGQRQGALQTGMQNILSQDALRQLQGQMAWAQMLGDWALWEV